MALIDAVKLMTFTRPGYALSGRYDIVDKDFIYAVKNPIGFPVDLRRYDNDWVYDQQTEVNWTDPGFIKFHVGNGGKGNRIVKRWLDPAKDFPFTVSETDSPLYYIRNGQSDYQLKTAGPTTHYWHKPEMRDWGKDVGNVLTYQDDYYWSGVLDLERYYYAPPFGLLSWNHSKLVAGKYVIDDQMATANVLQTVADWQRTYRNLTSFGYNIPFKSTTPLT